MSVRTRIALAAAVAALSLTVAVAPASAGTVDQQQTGHGNNAAVIGYDSGWLWTQVITAGRSGGLDQVDLPLYRDDATTGPLTVEIRDAPGGVPGSNVLASASLPATAVPAPGFNLPVPDVAVPFASPAPVLAGSQYAIVAHSSNSEIYYWWGGPGNVYAGGQGFYSDPAIAPTTWTPDFFISDFVFKTYVTSYDFTGFSSPVDNPPTVNKAKAGSSIPVKFSLGGNRGLGVLTTGYPKVDFYACDDVENIDDVETTSTANNGLTYNALTDTYTYVWKTNKKWSGCATLTFKFDDGSEHTALFQFK